MSLFNTKKETNKQPINEIQKAKGRRAKTAQQTIPYEEVYPNGIIKVAPGLYSKSYYFGDMNFTTEKEDKQEEILKKYSKLLSKYAPNVTAQFTVFNRRTSAAKIKERFLLKPKSDGQQIFRDDYNKILADKIEEGRNDIQKERYMTLTLKTTDIIMANRTFATLDEETDNAVREINKTGVRPLTIEERICILHDIYKVGEEDFFPDLLKDYYDDENKFSLEILRKRGLTTKDLIAPGNYMNGTMQIQLGDHNYAKTFLITNFPTAMDTSFLSEITNIPCSMLTSVIFKSYPHKKAIKAVKAQNSAIKSEVVKANQKAVKGNYDPSLISEDLLTAREEAADLVRDVTIIHNFFEKHKDAIISGYNVNFDIKFMTAYASRMKEIFEPTDVIDIFGIVKENIFPDEHDGCRKLSHILEILYPGKTYQFHNASDDILATWDIGTGVLKKFIESNPVVEDSKYKAQIASYQYWKAGKTQRLYVTIRFSETFYEIYYDIYSSCWVCEDSKNNEFNVFQWINMDDIEDKLTKIAATKGKEKFRLLRDKGTWKNWQNIA